MAIDNLMLDSPASLLVALLVLWFYTVWQVYVIDGTHARLAGLQEVWRETLALDPAWRYCEGARAVQKLLDASKQKLPRLSLGLVLLCALGLSRERAAARARIYESLDRLPSKRLREDAIGIVETATRYVVLAALKRSLLVWALAPLMVAGFVVWSAHWQLRILLEGAPQAAMQHARVRLRRKFIVPLVEIVASSPPA